MGALGRKGDRQAQSSTQNHRTGKTQGCRFIDDFFVNSLEILKMHSGNSHQSHITEGYIEGNGQISVGAP